MKSLDDMLMSATYAKKSGKMSLMSKAAMMADKKKKPYTMESVGKALKFMVTGKME